MLACLLAFILTDGQTCCPRSPSHPTPPSPYTPPKPSHRAALRARPKAKLKHSTLASSLLCTVQYTNFVHLSARLSLRRSMRCVRRGGTTVAGWRASGDICPLSFGWFTGLATVV
ncbi:hypothetical protein IWX50DRAFT_125821 [Phyllosticta citricarpa]